MDNISYEEAEQKFKPGDLFVASEKVGKNKYAGVQPGDVLRMEGFYRIGFDWGIVYSFVDKPNGDVKGQLLHRIYLELPNQLSSCHCNIYVESCKCGAFQREKEVGFVMKPLPKRTWF